MFNEFIDQKKLGGVNCLIWKDGRVIYQESQGYKNLDTCELMTPDSIFRISSMTKPITSVLTMMLHEEKKLNLTDPITHWFPEFGDMVVLNMQSGKSANANRLITILDLLTHRAGFTYSEFQHGKLKDDYISALGGDIDTELTNTQWIKGLASLPLVSQPGELFNYGRSTDLLGILISRIEGESLGNVMDEKIFKPLEMTDTTFDVPAQKRHRCASNFGYDESGDLVNLDTVPLNMAFKERPGNLEFESGGQGLWSTAGDYLNFAKLFIDHGGSNDIQILKPETVALMCSNHLTAPQREHSELMGIPLFREHYGFGLGLGVVMKESNYGSIPCAGSVGSVGWPGAYGGWWSADPVHKMISIFLTHSMTEPKQLAQGIGLELYEAIDLFSNYSRQLV